MILSTPPDVVWSEPKQWFSARIGKFALGVQEKPVTGGNWGWAVIVLEDGYAMDLCQGTADTLFEAGQAAYLGLLKAMDEAKLTF